MKTNRSLLADALTVLRFVKKPGEPMTAAEEVHFSPHR